MKKQLKTAARRAAEPKSDSDELQEIEARVRPTFSAGSNGRISRDDYETLLRIIMAHAPASN